MPCAVCVTHSATTQPSGTYEPTMQRSAFATSHAYVLFSSSTHVRDLPRVRALQLIDALVQTQTAAWRLRQIAMRGVPRHVTFEKKHVVAAVAQRAHQRAIN